MAEVLTEELSFGRYKYGYGTDGSQVRKLIWIDDDTPPPGLQPIIVSDFENGVYTVNGNAVALGDIWVNDGAWSPFDPSTVQAGVGLVGGNDTNPVLNSARSAELPFDEGMTIVITFGAGGSADWYLADQPGFTPVITLNTSETDQFLFNDVDAGQATVTGTLSAGDKVAVTMTATLMAVSMVGGAADSEVGTVGATFNFFGTVVDLGTTVRRIDFYEPQAASELPTLSA